MIDFGAQDLSHKPFCLGSFVIGIMARRRGNWFAHFTVLYLPEPKSQTL